VQPISVTSVYSSDIFALTAFSIVRYHSHVMLSLRRISRTRKIVLSTEPGDNGAKENDAKKYFNTRAPVEDDHPLPTAKATAASRTSQREKEINAFCRLMMRTVRL